MRRIDYPTSVRFPRLVRKQLREEAFKERRNMTDHLVYILQWWFANGGAKGPFKAEADAAQPKEKVDDAG